MQFWMLCEVLQRWAHFYQVMKYGMYVNMIKIDP